MIFDIDTDMIVQSVADALEQAAMTATEEQFNKIFETIDKTMPDVVDYIVYDTFEFWRQEARSVSTGWGDKYANSIKVNKDAGEVYVDDNMVDKTSDKPAIMFVEMVERGMKSFSIKDALLSSEKAKVSKDGVKYIVVPFPVRAPAKPTQGKMASHFGGREMTREMYNIVKGGGRLKSGTLKTGQDVSGLTQYNTRQLHGQYGIFRVVTEKSQGWIHPGVAPEPVFASVKQHVNEQIQKALHEYCKAIVKEFTA